MADMPRKKQIQPAALHFPKELQRKLDAIENYPLTIAEAPAGYGKTTALRHYFEQNEGKKRQVLWHTFLGEPAAICWKEVCSQLEKADPACACILLRLGPPNEDTIGETVQALQGLCCAQDTYLILDGLEHFRADASLMLTAFSLCSCKQFHVVAATRQISGERCGELLDSHRIFRLNARDFTFDCQDIDTYYRKVGLPLTRNQAEQLFCTTEGWVMALYLQALAYSNGGRFEKGDMDQLIRRALWQRLNQEEQKLFLAVSILPRFTLYQAVRLCCRPQEWVERVLRENSGFVHFDPESHGFYLHTLFAGFLNAEFAGLSEEWKRELYQRAGDLMQEAGNRLNALRFYHYAGAWELLFQIPFNSYEIADVEDQATRPMILDILDNAPREIKVKHPAALVLFAFVLFFLNEIEKLLTIQEEIHQIIIESRLPQRQKDELMGEMALLLSFLEYNRIDDMSARHRQAWALLQGPAALISNRSTWTFGSPSVLYLFWREAGKLDEEVEQLEQCMPLYYRLTRYHGAGAETIMRAEAYLLRGEISQAEILCHQALVTADAKNQDSIVMCSLFLLARIAVIQGDRELFQQRIRSIAEYAKKNPEDLCRYTQDLCLGFLATLCGDLSAVPSWLAEGHITQRRLVAMTQSFGYIIYGRCLLLKGDWRKLLGVSQPMMELSCAFANLLPQLYCRIYTAQAQDGAGQQTKARETLQVALDMALPDGIVLPFSENYQGLKRLLASLEQGEHGEQIRLICSLAQRLEKGCEAVFQPRPLLSYRERQVAQFVGEGLKNREIAQRLCVSTATVKNTLAHIYEKTGITSREQLKGYSLE